MLVEQLIKTNTNGGNYTSLQDFLNQKEIIELPFISQALTCSNESYKLISNSFVTGNIAKGKTSTIIDGGIFAIPITSLTSNETNTESDLYNNILNLISVKYAGSNDPVLDINDRTVYGLVQCDPTISDGDAIAAPGAENLRILFVVKDVNDDFVVTNVTGDIQVHFNALYALRYKPTLFKSNGVAKDIDVLKPPAEFQSLTDVVLTSLANNDFFFYDSATQKIKNIDASGSRTKLGLGTSSTLNVSSSGNASTGEVVKGDDTRLSDSRTPTDHTLTSHSDYPLNGFLKYRIDNSLILDLLEYPIAQANGNKFLYTDINNNSFLGRLSGNSTLSGTENSSFGYQNLIGLTFGIGNTVLGSNSGKSITTANYNVLIGKESGNAILTGSSNIGIGYRTLYGNGAVNTDASFNIAIGHLAMSYAGNGSMNNIALGTNALWKTSSGYNNIGIGSYSLKDVTTQNSNIGIGFQSLYTNVASNNVGIGTSALFYTLGGGNNTAIGTEAGYGIYSAVDSIAIGYRSLYGNGLGVLSNPGQIAIGSQALYTANASSHSNMAIGYLSLKSVTSGNTNIGIGYTSGYTLTTGSSNTFIGVDSGYNASGGSSFLTAIGYSALRSTSVATPSFSTAIGAYSSYRSTNGNNVCVGYQSGYTGNTSSFTNNTLLGYKAGYAAAQGNNTLVGHEAGVSITSGAGNNGLGYRSLYYITTASNNTAIGQFSGLGLNSSSSNNVAIGSYSLYGNGANSITNSGQVAIGFESLYTANASSNLNTAVGTYSGRGISSGISNTLLGYQAGWSISTGSNNIAIGTMALQNSTTSNEQIAIGTLALGAAIASSSSNLAIGHNSFSALTTGVANIGIGRNSGLATTGNSNVFIGNASGFRVTSGSENIGIGANTFYGNGANSITNSGQIAIGHESLYTLNSSATANTSIGYKSLRSLTSGSNNTVFGYQSGMGIISGTGNTFIGRNSGNVNPTTTGNNNVFIGDQASEANSTTVTANGESPGNISNSIAIGYNTVVEKSNKIQIGNTSIVETQFGNLIKFTSTVFKPLNSGMDLGSVSTERFNFIYTDSLNLFDRVTDAPTPTEGVVIYIKNGELKSINSSGTIKTYSFT